VLDRAGALPLGDAAASEHVVDDAAERTQAPVVRIVGHWGLHVVVLVRFVSPHSGDRDATDSIIGGVRIVRAAGPHGRR
jgi:hypothetical protein